MLDGKIQYTDIILSDDQVVKNLVLNMECYRQEGINLHLKQGLHGGYNYKGAVGSFEQIKNKTHGIPVYYQKIGSGYYLSPAAIGREVFNNTLRKIIDSYTPCKKKDDLCQTCSLFGFLGEDAAASRVRFTDAKLNKESAPVKSMMHNANWDGLFEKPCTLPELSSPKPSATEFYLKRPNDADLWNYDYALKWDTNPLEINGYKPEIRGRKFYWHKKLHTVDSIKILDAKATNRNVHVRPLKKGVIFTTRVYFNHVSNEELKKILWVLTFGKDAKTHAHKLGMGKPLGLGSVRTSVLGVKQRSIKLEGETIQYCILDLQPEDLKIEEMKHTDLQCQENSLRDFLIITNYDKAPDNVIYPQNVGSEKVYEWFVTNRISTASNAMKPTIVQSLPCIKDISPSLKMYAPPPITDAPTNRRQPTDQAVRKTGNIRY